MKALVGAVVCLSMYSPAEAAVEAVLVKKVMDDKAIVVRASGETYLIEKGIGCLSLWRFEGKRVHIDSPGLFLGIGSTLLITDLDQQCRIWHSEAIGSDSSGPIYRPPGPPRTAVQQASGESTILVQQALKILGYDLLVDGAPTGKTSEAFERYRVSKNHPPTQSGINQSILSLSMDVLNRKPTSSEAFAVAMGLFNIFKTGSGPSSIGCSVGNLISSITSGGRIIKLEDGSTWEVDAVDTVTSTRWVRAEDVLICGQMLIMSANGEKVRGKLLK